LSAKAPYDGPIADAVSAGLSGHCPRCGEGKLFDGFLTVKPECRFCHLDLRFADAGDGPAVFVILIAGFFVVGLALYTEITYEPPMWVHMVIFLPMTLIVCLGMLRPLKGLMIGLQYRNKAEQGQLAP
jgi:uncharacterized protein (DUF983 family)